LNPKAYFVKGSVIALRNSDASLIEVDILWK
jgi:Fe2+ transport system protein FeoA